MKRVPVETEFGYLFGRDAIFLDEVIYDCRNLTLKGEFNGILCSKKQNSYITYEIEFKGVYYFRSIELDVSITLDNKYWHEGTNFDEILDSDVLKAISKARNLKLRHFLFLTYDDVFEIACQEFVLKTTRIREKTKG